ncbi:MAG: response regulator [Bacillota bacterium]
MSLQRIFKVIVAEDEMLILKKIIEKIESINPMFRVVGSASNGKEALELVTAMKPDVLFTDISMPVMDGIDLVKRAKEIDGELLIVILSGYDLFSYAQQAMKYGACEYMLKPIKLPAMESLLNDLEATLVKRRIDKTKSMIADALKGQKSERSWEYFNGYRFAALLLCAGNINYCDKRPGYLRELWKSMPWQKAGTQEMGIHEWWYLPLDAPNECCFVVAGDRLTSDTVHALGESLKDLLNTHMGLPVAVSASTQILELCALNETVQTERDMLIRYIVPGRPQTIYSDLCNWPYPPIISNVNFERGMEVLLRCGDLHGMKKMLEAMLDEWDISAMPQSWRISMLQQMSKWLYRIYPDMSGDLIYTYDMEIYDAISSCIAFVKSYERIWKAFEKIAVQDTNRNFSGESVAYAVEGYIKANYPSITDIGRIASEFSFSCSYISKVFRQSKGISIMKYITNLRMETAKHMLKNAPDMSVKLIGEAVGYQDQHYFSRIFRNSEGISPAEYRLIVLKGK